MQWYEILIIIAAAMFVAWVIIRAIIRKKKGIVGCDCCDGGCSACSKCSSEKQQHKSN